jgi:N6-L-threonylcarbamoyladenine synthase
MQILGIESSCDETGVALVETTGSAMPRLLSHALYSQIEMHQAYGGVVPELASRDHIRRVLPLTRQVLAEAGAALADIDVVAYTRGPGLAGALLVGSGVACALAASLGKPVLGVHHLEGHLLSPFLSADPPQFPFVALLVSGGHTQLMRVDGVGRYELLGETIDDAAGEALDKAAKVMGLPYPGGPHVDRLAKEGDPRKYTFTTPNIPAFNYSFSGLKTNLLYFLRDRNAADANFIGRELNHICASYQHVVTEYLLAKLEAAAAHYNVRQVALAGGVSANSALRSKLTVLCERRGWSAFIPPLGYCTDNAAMIGISGYYQFLHGHAGAWNDVPRASWPLDGSLS